MPDLRHRDASVDEEQMSGVPAPRQFRIRLRQRVGFYTLLAISAKSPTRKQRGLTGTEGSNPLRSANESLSPGLVCSTSRNSPAGHCRRNLPGPHLPVAKVKPKGKRARTRSD